MLQLVEIHELAMQVKKLAPTSTSFAHQAMSGWCPCGAMKSRPCSRRHEQLILRAIALSSGPCLNDREGPDQGKDT